MSFETIFEKYGLPGVVIVALVFVIKWGANLIQKILKEHKDERKEWSSSFDKLDQEHRKSQEIRDEKINKVIDANTAGFNSFKTLFESNLNKK